MTFGSLCGSFCGIVVAACSVVPILDADNSTETSAPMILPLTEVDGETMPVTMVLLTIVVRLVFLGGDRIRLDDHRIGWRVVVDQLAT